MIDILIMRLGSASFILRMKSRVLQSSEVGMIMVSICNMFTWRQFFIPGQRPWAIWYNKNGHSWKIPPICLKILPDLNIIQYFKQNDQVLSQCLFIWVYEGLSIPKALHIDVWEMAWVTAMAASGEQTWSAYACDVSMGTRITLNNIEMTIMTLSSLGWL